MSALTRAARSHQSGSQAGDKTGAQHQDLLGSWGRESRGEVESSRDGRARQSPQACVTVGKSPSNVINRPRRPARRPRGRRSRTGCRRRTGTGSRSWAPSKSGETGSMSWVGSARARDHDGDDDRVEQRRQQRVAAARAQERRREDAAGGGEADGSEHQQQAATRPSTGPMRGGEEHRRQRGQDRLGDQPSAPRSPAACRGRWPARGAGVSSSERMASPSRSRSKARPRPTVPDTTSAIQRMPAATGAGGRAPLDDEGEAEDQDDHDGQEGHGRQHLAAAPLDAPDPWRRCAAPGRRTRAPACCQRRLAGLACRGTASGLVGGAHRLAPKPPARVSSKTTRPRRRMTT